MNKFQIVALLIISTLLGCQKSLRPTVLKASIEMKEQLKEQNTLGVQTDWVRIIGINPINFDFDKYNLRLDAQSVISSSLDIIGYLLENYKEAEILIEGYCDERGTKEYNFGLGQRRANEIFGFLVSSGMDKNRLQTKSYGESRPVCLDKTEVCWQVNRRAVIKFRESRP